MNSYHILRRFIARNEGATAVEFALVALPFFMLLLGIIEYGMFMLTKVSLESVVTQAGRMASITTGGGPGTEYPSCGKTDRVCVVKQYIERKSAGLLNSHGVNITSRVITGTNNGAPPFAGDLCTENGVSHVGGPCPIGTPGVFWTNLGGTPGYDAGRAIASVGSPGDLIELQIVYPWDVLNPIFKPFFGADSVVIRSTIVVKNED